MKKLLLICVITFFTFKLFSQDTDTLKGVIPVISVEKLNILYKGLINPITVSIPGYKSDRIIVELKDGTITGDSGKYFVIIPNKPYLKEAVLKVYLKMPENKRKYVFSKHFRLMPIPQPTTFPGAKDSPDFGVFPKYDPYIRVQLEGFAFEGISYKVIRFTLIYKPLNGQEISLNSQSNSLTNEMKNITNHLKSGDKLMITNVFVQCYGDLVSDEYSREEIRAEDCEYLER